MTDTATQTRECYQCEKQFVMGRKEGDFFDTLNGSGFHGYCSIECAVASRRKEEKRKEAEIERVKREVKPLSEVVAGDIVIKTSHGSWSYTEVEAVVMRTTKTLIILQHRRFRKEGGGESGSTFHHHDSIEGVTEEGLRAFREKQNTKKEYNELRNGVHGIVKKLEERYNGRYGDATKEKLENLKKVEVLLKQIEELK